MLKGMIERRMRAAMYAVASFWYTAWVDAGQPSLTQLSNSKVFQKDLNGIRVIESNMKEQSNT